MKFDLVTFGEAILRFSPADGDRLVRADRFDCVLGGAELNVAAGAAQLGMNTAYLTKLPDNRMGEYAASRINSAGVCGDLIAWDGEDDARLALYYMETGAAPRKPAVVYDRRHSSFTKADAADFAPAVEAGARLFHTCGISLALCQRSRAAAKRLVEAYKAQGALISFDVNYRANLWGEAEARATIEELLPLVDILFISEESCRRMFARTGELEQILRDFAAQYGLKLVATTQRKVLSPQRHSFTALIYDAASDAFFTQPPYEIDVVDRIGSGDAFVAGVLSGVLKGEPAERALRYGNAMAALKSTVCGDLPCTNLAEVERLIAEHDSGAAGSEMDR